MKKLLLGTALATVFLAPQVHAQSGSFEGFSARLSVNFNNNKTEIPQGSPTDSSTTSGIRAAYGWALGSQFVLSAHLSYDMGTMKAGSQSGVNAEAKNLSTLGVSPGFKVTPNFLAYATLGYSSVKGEISGTFKGTETYDGLGYGAGVRYLLAKSWSVDAEYFQTTFTGKYSKAALGDIKPSLSVYSIGVNYHF